MTPSPTPPTPIPITGDVQIFADADCNEYPDGTYETLYARINVPWGLDGSWVGTAGNYQLDCGAPAEGYETEPYGILLNRIGEVDGFASSDYDRAFTAGEIVVLNGGPLDFDGGPLVFTNDN